MNTLKRLLFLVLVIGTISGESQAINLSGNYISTAWGNDCVNPWGTEMNRLEAISSEDLKISPRRNLNGGGFRPDLELIRPSLNDWYVGRDLEVDNCDRLQKCVFASFRGVQVENHDLLVVSTCVAGVLKTKFKFEPN